MFFLNTSWLIYYKMHIFNVFNLINSLFSVQLLWYCKFLPLTSSTEGYYYSQKSS